MSAVSRPVVDPETGNLDIQGRASIVLFVKFEGPTAGDFQNIAARNLYFEVGGQFRNALAAGPDVYTRTLVITRPQVANLPLDYALPFVLLDETPEDPRAVWSGIIEPFGFRVQPPGAPAYTGTATDLANATVTVSSVGVQTEYVIINYALAAWASAISYDNSDSGIPATNVQEAIDFLAGLSPYDGRLDFSKRANSAYLAVI